MRKERNSIVDHPEITKTTDVLEIKCPNCGKEIIVTGSCPIAEGKYWTVSNHYLCDCGMWGKLLIGHGKMYGKEKMIWEMNT